MGIKLVIPSIQFEKSLYDIDSELNNVDYNVEVLKESSYGDKLFYIAGHSGNGDNCYFNRIKELEMGDIIYIYIKDKMLIYEVKQIYFIRKNGYMEVDNVDKDVLFLITCNGYNRQLIVKGVLIN